MSEPKNVTIDLWLAVLFAAAAVCAIGVCTLIFFKWGSVEPGALTTEMIQERETKLTDLESGMTKERSSYRWISKDKGTVQLSIDRAMELTLKDLQNKPPRASGVPVDPAPAPTPAAPATEPAAEEVAPAVEAETEKTPVEKTPVQEGASA
jgi:hypothetical protein